MLFGNTICHEVGMIISIFEKYPANTGAGGGNRTRLSSLGSSHTTDVLRPLFVVKFVYLSFGDRFAYAHVVDVDVIFETTRLETKVIFLFSETDVLSDDCLSVDLKAQLVPN